MAASTKAYDIGTAWTLVGSNCTQIYIAANGQYDLYLYIGSASPSEDTRDFVPIESTDTFGAGSLTSGVDTIYLKCSSPVTVPVKVLTL